MRKTYFKSLLIAAMCLTGGGITAFAADTDVTSKVSTSASSWGVKDLTGAWASPLVTPSGGTEVGLAEHYETVATNTGTNLKQEISGLTNGTYVVSVYANAMYTSGRGFASTLTDGAKDVAFVYAKSGETTVKTPITAKIASGTTINGEYMLTIQVTDGTLEIGLNKEKAGTNWENIQIKSLILTEDADALYKSECTSLLSKATTEQAADTYKNFTSGSVEKKALDDAVTNYSDVSSDYANAVATINDALYTYCHAKASYATYANFQTNNKALIDAIGLSVTEPTTAADAAAYPNNTNVSEYNTITSNYVDYTSSFDSDTSYDGWTKTGSYQNNRRQHWDGTTDGTTGTPYNESDFWSSETGGTATFSKELTLPQGKYVLKVAGRRSADASMVFTATDASNNTLGTVSDFPAGDSGKGIDTSGAANFGDGTFANSNNGRGWQWRFMPLELSSETKVTVTFTISSSLQYNWAGFCNFAILASKETAESFSAGTEDYAALNTAIENAETHTLGFEAGEYAPYKNVDAAKALAAAKAIDQTASNTKAAVTAATTALNNATWGTANTKEVNAVNNGDFSEATLSSASGDANAELQKFGWTAANGLRLVFSSESSNTEWAANAAKLGTSKAVFAWSNTVAEYGKTSGYTMPLKANTKYQLTVQFAGWGGAAKKCKASVLNSKSEGLAETNFGDVAKSTESITTFKKVFTTGEAGDYVLQLKAEGNYVIANISILKAVPDDITLKGDASAAPTASEYANVTLERTFATGWNSVVLPFATTPKALGASEAAKYTGTDGTTINFSTIAEDGTLDANKPYLVYFKTAKENPTFEGVAVAPTTSLTVADAAETKQYSFVGTYTAIDSGSETIKAGDYIVVGDGIQKAKGGNALKAFRAYFQAQEGANKAKNMVISIDGNVVTGIDAVSTSEPAANASAPAYNLAGQRVGKSYKGVVIVNGKKVIRK